MSIEFGKFVVNYLLFPVIVLILGLLSVVIAKKNKLLSDKKAVITVLGSSLFYSLFGFSGFFGMTFMPYVYLFIQFLFLLLGFVNQKLLSHFIPQLKSMGLIFVVLLQFFISWAVFAIIFNITNELQYGFWAGTCLLPILFYPLFVVTYQCYLSIPAEIYKIRVYRDSETFEPPHAELDVSQVMVVGINVPKYVGDENEAIVNSKSLKSFVLGEWFGMIINDYNAQHLDNQVELFDKEGSYGWIFYTEKSFFKSRKYLDPDLTFESNGLVNNCMIVARRVKNVK
ncbi:MAG: TssN family type VI secretion system protein [Paludibacteraceae bacterium]|nr:TssN family type VI secretion system protein [Paludibacteraceae bacterium]